ncbi:MAG TPA: hypothetical protein VMU51_24715 [Mycobacteriales bacterium]|nr:hypothetical protein [Mycobacteriales bacterium]
MGGVFINYRVLDQALGAAAIHALLVGRFGADQVFSDCVPPHPGGHYPAELRKALASADVLVTVIGPHWLDRTDTGLRLVDRDFDWVRRELAFAFGRGIPVLPVALRDSPAGAPRLTRADLPPDIAALADQPALEVSQRRFGADGARLAARLVQLAPALLVPRLFAAPVEPRPAGSAPSTLLRPEFEVVRFAGRSGELADLQAWACGSATVAARLLVGPAGVGKTRLAGALVERLTRLDWLAGSVGSRAPAAELTHTAELDRPLLAVLDDAELRAEQLVALALALADRPPSAPAPARLLLLSRSAGGWLAALAGHPDRRVADLFAPVAAGALWLDAGLTDPVAEIDPASRYAAALTAFAAALDRSAPAAPAVPVGCRTILDLHATALDVLLTDPADPSDPPALADATRSGPPALTAPADPADPLRPADRPGPADQPGPADPQGPAERSGPAGTAADVLDRLLGHDRAQARRLALVAARPDLEAEQLELLAALATLCRPDSAAEAVALLAHLPAFLGESRYPLADHVTVLRRLYPGRHAVNPVRPDALGERLVAAAVGASPELVVTLAHTGTADQVGIALTVLGRALPAHPQVATAIVDLIRAAPDRLILTGVDVAARLAEPALFSRALGIAISDGALSVAGVFALMHRLRTAGQGLNPLRVATLRGYAAAVAGPLATRPEPVRPLGELRSAGDADLPAALERLAESVPDLLLDAFDGLLDPDSGRFPTGPDGRRSVPPAVLEALRKVVLNGAWRPRHRPGGADPER